MTEEAMMTVWSAMVKAAQLLVGMVTGLMVAWRTAAIWWAHLLLSALSGRRWQQQQQQKQAPQQQPPRPQL